MKLPGAIRTGVRGLAQQPSGAQATLAQGAAIAQVGGMIGQEINEYQASIAKMEQERSQEEMRQLNLSMMQSQAEFNNVYNKSAYSADEIPDGVDARLTDTEFVNGQEVAVPREDIPAYEVKAQIYQDAMTKRAKAGAERITNEEDRKRWLDDKLSLIELNATKILGESQKEQREYNAKRLAVDIDGAVDAGQFDVALALTSDIKNADLRVDARKQIRTAKELNEYDTLILTKDNPESWQATEEAITMLRDPEQKSALTTEQRVNEAGKLERALTQGKQDFAIAQKSQIANAVADVKVDLDSGSVDYTKDGFKKQRDAGNMTNAQYISYTRQLDNNIKALEESQKAKYEIQAGYINPKNKSHMKAADEEFMQLAQATNPWAASQQIVTKYNVLPPAVNNAFNMANITGGENLASAAVQYSLLNETNPVAMMNVKAERVQQVAAYLELGMTQGQALESLALNESLSSAQLETRKAMVSGRENMEESADALGKMFDDSFDTYLFSEPDLPVFMTAEFAAATEAFLPKSGFDIEVARKMAFNTIKGKYAPTEINGSPQILPYMPQQPPELVRRQIKSQLGDGVIIQSDQLTENQAMLGDALTYMAYKDLGDGNIEMLERFEYDPQSIQDAQVKDQEAKQKKALDDAIAEREEIEAKKARAKTFRGNRAKLKSYAEKVEVSL